MKAIVILHNGDQNHIKGAVRAIIEDITASLNAEHVEVSTLNDDEVANLLIKGTNVTKNVEKRELNLSDIECACEYVHHLYGEDIIRMPSSEIEADMLYKILNIDNVHTAKLKQACQTIVENKAKANVWFANKHSKTLLQNVYNVMMLIQSCRR